MRLILSLSVALCAGSLAHAANPAAQAWKSDQARVVGRYVGQGETRIKKRWWHVRGGDHKAGERAYQVERSGDQLRLTWYGPRPYPGAPRNSVTGKIVATTERRDGSTRLEVVFEGLDSKDSISMGKDMGRFARSFHYPDNPNVRGPDKTSYADLQRGTGTATLTFGPDGGLDIKAQDIHERNPLEAINRAYKRTALRERLVPKTFVIKSKMKLRDAGDEFLTRDVGEIFEGMLRQPGFDKLPND
jgi:hypothetical protein